MHVLSYVSVSLFAIFHAINTVIYTELISPYSFNEILNIGTGHVTCQLPSWQRIRAVNDDQQRMVQDPSRLGSPCLMWLTCVTGVDDLSLFQSDHSCLVCLRYELPPPRKVLLVPACYRTGTAHTCTTSRNRASSSEDYTCVHVHHENMFTPQHTSHHIRWTQGTSSRSES